MSEEQQSQHLWMEDKLTGMCTCTCEMMICVHTLTCFLLIIGMDMIGDEHFEPTGELYDFLTER